MKKPKKRRVTRKDQKASKSSLKVPPTLPPPQPFLRTNSAQISVPNTVNKFLTWTDPSEAKEMADLKKQMRATLRAEYALNANGSYELLLDLASSMDEEMLRAIASSRLDYYKLGHLFKKRLGRLSKH